MQSQPPRPHLSPNCEQAASCEPHLFGILDRSHLPGVLQPEISSSEETHGTPGKVPSWSTQETIRLGLGKCIRHTAHLGQCTRQAPGAVWTWEGHKRHRPSGSVPLWSTQEPERLRPGKCLKCRAHLGQCPCRAPWNLSSVDPGSTCLNK